MSQSISVYSMPVCPVKLDHHYDVEIFSIGRNGDGIAKIDNFVLIIPDTKVGEKVTVRVEKIFQKYAFAMKMKK